MTMATESRRMALLHLPRLPRCPLDRALPSRPLLRSPQSLHLLRPRQCLHRSGPSHGLWRRGRPARALVAWMSPWTTGRVMTRGPTPDAATDAALRTPLETSWAA